MGAAKLSVNYSPYYNEEINFARNTGKKVYQYDSSGVLLKEYPSVSFAARELKVDPSLINKCCNKIKQSCKGYFWSYSPDEIFKEMKLVTWKKYQIVQKNLILFDYHLHLVRLILFENLSF